VIYLLLGFHSLLMIWSYCLTFTWQFMWKVSLPNSLWISSLESHIQNLFQLVMINTIWIWWTINIFKLIRSIICKHLPDDRRSKPLRQQFVISPVMMSNIKHHDKVTFFELLFFHLLIKSFLLLILHDFNGLVGSYPNSLNCNNWWCWDSSKGIFIVMAMRKVITFSLIGKNASIP